VTSDNFVIIDETEGPEVIGEVDFSSALSMVHPKAIYIHEGQQYHVERLEFEQRKAYVRKVDVDYFTQAIRYTEVKTLEVAEEEHVPGPAVRAYGDVLVRSQVVGFKKIKFFTLENVGSGNLELPENEMHTTAYWIKLDRELLSSLPFSISERQDGMFGLLYAMESIASLLLMCDRLDLGSTIGEGLTSGDDGQSRQESRAMNAGRETRELFEPTLYLYDAYPGGMGMSEPLYRIHGELIRKTRELIASCGCENGCPSCVGPVGETGPHTKEAALAILRLLCS
jgi:DEAD/DEAH box helicase domain-containing protein